MLKQFATVSLAALGLALALMGTAGAAPSDSEMPKKAEKTTSSPSRRYFALPKEIQLTTEQKVSFEEIKQKLEPKANQLFEKREQIMTDDQKSARTAAMAKAKTDGMTGKARTLAIDQAVKLTDDQKKQYAEIKADLAKIHLEIKQQIHEILTTEQQAYYKLPMTKKSSPPRESKPSTPEK